MYSLFKGVVGLNLYLCILLQRLEASVELNVSDICHDLEVNLGIKFSTEVRATLSNLALNKIKSSAEDLEAFANHGKRINVAADDVKLLTRRNHNLVINS